MKSIYIKDKKIYIVKTLFHVFRHLAGKVVLSLLSQRICPVTMSDTKSVTKLKWRKQNEQSQPIDKRFLQLFKT